MGEPTPDPLIGATLGRYTLEARLGAGGMGAVYRAREAGILERTVALKVLPARLAGETEFVARFAREARRASGLRHGNVVQIYDADEADGHYFMAMQLMDGGSLADLIARHGALEPGVAARVVRDAARGLACAHKAGIVHRDVKPANIFLDDEGARLGDFGLVKALDDDDQPLTQTGMILGTPHYMAPEQCEGATDVDHRADLYALGLVLYHALSGTIPAKGKTPLQIIRHRCMEDPQPLREVRPDVPPELASTVDALLVRERSERLQSADELARRLDRFLASVDEGSVPTLATPRDSLEAREAGDAPTRSHALAPPDAETVDLPAGPSDVAPSTGLSSGAAAPPTEATPPTPPSVATPPPAPATGATPPPPAPATSANPPTPPPTPATLPPQQAARGGGRVLLTTCLALLAGVVLLPAGCMALVVALSEPDFPITGSATRTTADGFLRALGPRARVQLLVGEPRLNEVVDLELRGDLEGEGLTVLLGPFADDEFGDDWRLELTLAAPNGTLRATGGRIVNPTKGPPPPPIGLFTARLEGEPEQLVVEGNWTFGTKSPPVAVRVSSRHSAVPTEEVDPEELLEERFDALRDRAEADAYPQESVGNFALSVWRAVPLIVHSREQGTWSGLYANLGVDYDGAVVLEVDGLPKNDLGCDRLRVFFREEPDPDHLLLVPLRVAGTRYGREIFSEPVEDWSTYASGACGYVLELDPSGRFGQLSIALQAQSGGK